MNPEKERLSSGEPWKMWGPYVAERAWGTVREDYSADGKAWDYLPHEHARSRAYRWSEDGLAGISDDCQRLCFALAFWNGRDPILKERIFGLSGTQGNHGEDAKEYWWYADSTPTHSWMRWQYVYPQAEFPYDRLVAENSRRGRTDPEFELLDTGIFDGDRYWDVEVDYAKAAPTDVCIRIAVRNAGPDEATLDVLPTLWFRNAWSWDVGATRPEIAGRAGELTATHHELGTMTLTGEGGPAPLLCDNDTNTARLWSVPGPAYPKDGIGDHLIHGAATVNPSNAGTKGALHYRLTVAPGKTAEIRLRLSDRSTDLGAGWAATMRLRREEADEFYGELAPDADPEEALVMRQALAGMLWSKQYYRYDVARWLDGDPTQPPPPAERRDGRNSAWRHVDDSNVISMPDKWEYPWFAAWDLAFHCVALAHVDPEFAKEQLILLLREWYQHPNGQLPAYEWDFSDVNPPVHAWAALRVFEIDGSRDFDFLERVMHKLLLNFTWWVNRKDSTGNNVFEGGFLGLDNIGPIDRSQVPEGGLLEQSDGTAWMAFFCLDLLEMSFILAEHDRTYEDLAVKFFEHFALIAEAMNDKGLWDEEDGFYYDVLSLPGRPPEPLRVRSMVGLIPLCSATTLGRATMERLPAFAERFRWFLENRPQYDRVIGNVHTLGVDEGRLFSIVGPNRLRRILERMLDEEEFLSPHGLRALSRYHLDHPFSVAIDGTTATVDYEPAESTTPLFGGNSNWRGPVWFPANYLVIEALRRYARYFGDDFTVECPTGSGQKMSLCEVSDELSRRLVATFLDDGSGRRPVFGGVERFQSDPAWHDRLLFYEYFNGDDGAGLGASHQTGWTGLVADVVIGRASGGVRPIGADTAGAGTAGADTAGADTAGAGANA
jgi:hypothetical protein